MQDFNAQAFAETRKHFHAATNASFASCIFKEFKDCMTVACAAACRREFHLDSDALWIACDDTKLQRWLAEHFGPSSKNDAIRRLEAVKFPNHSDSTDMQSTFVSKLNSCATDFNFVINDIADTHSSWSSDTTLISTGELSFKEVMDIWRKKFAKQERSVFSCQIKTCRDYMDRQKDMEFNDIVQMLSRHFTGIDTDVPHGRTAYTTSPTSVKHTTTTPLADCRANPRPVPNATLGKRDRTFGRPSSGHEASAKSPAKFARKIIAGHLRGIACGSVTNHFGLGCSATTCPFWGMKHDMNKLGHVWKDSESEPSVNIAKPEFDALLMAKPGILTKWAAAKDVFYKAKLSARVAAIHEGSAVSDSDDINELDDDDIQAACDEFGQHATESDVENEVNNDQCVVSALASPLHSPLLLAAKRAAQLLQHNKMKQFFGVSRIGVDSDANYHQIKTLIDPGAEYNIVSPAVRNLCVLDTSTVQVALFQGKKKQCVIDELSL